MGNLYKDFLTLKMVRMNAKPLRESVPPVTDSCESLKNPLQLPTSENCEPELSPLLSSDTED